MQGSRNVRNRAIPGVGLAPLQNLTNEVAETRHLTLESYLIKPVQRICKYPLIIKVRASGGALQTGGFGHWRHGRSSSGQRRLAPD